MADLVNNESGQLEPIAPEDVGNAFLSGKYNLPANQRVPLKDPKGKIVSIHPTEVFDSIMQGGYSFPNSKELEEGRLESLYGDAPGAAAKAFGIGIVKGVPVLGGLALKGAEAAGIGPSSEAIQQLSERHPIASGLGEATTLVGGLALAPEAGALRAAQEAYKVAEATGDAAQIAETAKAVSAAQSAMTTLGAQDVVNPIGAISKAGRIGAEAMVPISDAAATNASRVLQYAEAAGHHAIGSAIEGGLFTAGSKVNDMVLGDPTEVSEGVVGDIGLASLIGAGAGAALGFGGKLFSDLSDKYLSKALRDAATRDAVSEAASKEAGIVRAPRPPQSAAEMEEMLANHPSVEEGMPQKAQLAQYEKDIADTGKASQFPVHNDQMESLNDPQSRLDYKVRLENDPNTRQLYQDYEAAQKSEATNYLKDTIKSIAPEEKLVTGDTVKAGNYFTEAAERGIAKENAEMAPLFDRFRNATEYKIEHPGSLVDVILKSVPEAEKYIEYDGVNGAVRLAKYNDKMGFSKQTYNRIKSLLDGVNGEEMSIGDVWNMKKRIDDTLKWDSPGEDKRQLGALKKNLLGYVQDHVQMHEPDIQVKELFKRYAINQANKDTLEHMLGGNFGPYVKYARKIVPEDVLKNVFSDTVSVKAAKDILSKADFDHALANYLQHRMDLVTDNAKGMGFSSHKFDTFLREKAPELSTAFGSDQNANTRIKALTGKMKILPDSPPGNPSHTADKALSIGQQLKGFRNMFKPSEWPAMAHDFMATGESTKKSAAVTNAILAGKTTEEIAKTRAATYGVLSGLEAMKNRTMNSIQSGARAIMSKASDAGGIAGYTGAKAKHLDDKQKEKRMDKFIEQSGHIMAMANNPDAMISKVDETTKSISQHAPNVAQGIQNAMVRGTHFLASKAPVPDRKPLSPDWKPSRTDISKWNKYYDVVNDPISVFRDMKNGVLRPEAVEALTAVFPKLYEKMQNELMNQYANRNAPLPYKKRQMLSVFMNQDLDGSMNPQSIMMNQNSINGPSMQQNENLLPIPKAPKMSAVKGLTHISESFQTPMQRSATRGMRK